MTSPIFHHLLIPFLVAMFLAINMGGSGTAPSFALAFGSGVIKRNLIPGLFGVMVFLGAIIAGKATALTIGSELINPDRLNYQVTTIILLSISLSLFLANLLGIPQSTSQATVLSVSAASFYFHEFNSKKLFLEIVPTWFILPLLAYLICYFTGKYIYNPLRKKGVFLSAAVNNHPMIKILIIATSLYVAFSIGANNVANAAGPIAVMSINELGVNFSESNFILIIILSTLLIAPNFGIGSSLFGYKIVKHTGKDIIMLGKIEAVIIAFVSASLLLVASIFKGIPSSLVQVNVAAILGIGVAKLGAKNIFKRTHVSRFFMVWIIAPVMAFLLTFIGLYILEHIKS
ncbi:MAG: anion permease [Bacteroidota bacterium]